VNGHPAFGPLLAGIAILVVAAKAGGLLAERMRQPAVLGELVVGIGLGNLFFPVLGAARLEFIRSDPTLLFLAELGVLILLFGVGLEADLRALARVGPSSLLVAVIGVAAPIVVGWGVAAWWLPELPRLVHVFIAATLSATSIGITARVLKDLGATRSREGQIILGAAILDDVLGLIVLAIVAGLVTATAAGAAVSAAAIVSILVRAALFLAATIAIGHFFSGRIVRLAARPGHPETMLVVGLAICFACAYVAELVGLADIVGAFAAGLMLDPYGEGIRTREHDATLEELLHPLSSLFVPLFFVLMGVQVEVRSLLDPTIFAFAMLLTGVALVGKLACALGVVARGVDRLVVGIGMIPRGEVGLIFAGIGSTLTLQGRPILTESLFSSVVVMVLVTTLVTPVALRWAFGRHERRAGATFGSD
jgi:Kef-type K+ transport system membrane component KefB